MNEKPGIDREYKINLQVEKVLLDSMTYKEITGKHTFDCEPSCLPYSLNDTLNVQDDLSAKLTLYKLNILDPSVPLMNTHILSSSSSA